MCGTANSIASHARRWHVRVLAMLAGFLFTWSAVPAWAAYRVDIDAPRSIKSLLTDFLDLVRYRDRDDLNPDQLNFMVATAPEQVQRLTATEGYFSPKTTVKVENADTSPVVRVSVDPGPRTTVRQIDLQVAGAASTESPQQVQELRSNWPLTPGKPFRQQDWSSAKQGALETLRNRRYAAAQLDESRAAIDPDTHRADLAVNYDSGPSFTIGQLNITGTRRYPENIVRNINPLHEGETYSADRLAQLQRQIQRTPYFSNAIVDIDRNPDHAALAPVNVRVTEFPTQQIRGAAGYTTDTGAHVEGNYAHNNVFGRAWVFNSQLRIEQRRQLGSLELSMPPDASAFVNNAHTSYERTTLEGVDLRSRRLGLRRSRNTEEMDLAYTLEYYNDRLEQINGAALPPDTVVQPGSHQALVAGVAWTRRRLDNPLFPRSGHIVSVELGGAVKGPVTDQTFFRIYSHGQKYLPVARRDLVLLRAELGAVISKGGNAEIPASLLYRAGGTNSIRGYSYQSIGNESNGTVYPTRYLATGSVEYQHWLNDSWGAAVFYDVGTATDSWPEKSLFNAVGAGARYRSPVGTINADLGYGIQRHQIRPHISLGMTF